jgi:hypothetical protein
MYQNSDLYEKGKKIFRQTVVLIGAGALKIRKTNAVYIGLGDEPLFGQQYCLSSFDIKFQLWL